jgi:hypothetical protein
VTVSQLWRHKITKDFSKLVTNHNKISKKSSQIAIINSFGYGIIPEFAVFGGFRQCGLREIL